MATPALYIPQCKPEWSDNLLPTAANFEGAETLHISSGAGDLSRDTSEHYYGTKSISCQNYTLGTPLVFDMGSALATVIPKTDSYWLSIRLQQGQNQLQYRPHVFRIFISINGSFAGNVSMDITLPVTGDDLGVSSLDKDTWYTFGIPIDLVATDTIDFKFSSTLVSGSLSGNLMRIDGMKLERNDRVLGVPSMYSPPIE